MILPDKNIKLEYSLLNCDALILYEIREPKTISLLWEQVKQKETLDNYEKFVLTLDFLFIINAIKLNDGFLERCKNDSFC